MKKILFLFLLLISIEKVNAVNIQLTKVVANVRASYSGNRKDTILQNGARITSNLFPIAYFNFHFKWQGLGVVGPVNDETVYFEIYSLYGRPGASARLYSQAHVISSTDQDDSTSMPLLLNLPPNVIGQEYGYEIRITYRPANAPEVILGQSNSWIYSFVNDPNKIYYNNICCSKVVTLPYQPTDSITKDPNVGTITATATYLPIKYIWESSIAGGAFLAIPGATSASYLPGRQTTDTYYRRVAIAYNGSNEINYDVSNTVSLAREICLRPPTTTENIICGDQGFYNLKNGDIISPSKIIGSKMQSPLLNREEGYEFSVSYDGINWQKQIGLFNSTPQDHTVSDLIFNINNGNVQYIYYRRDYLEKYDEWSCDVLGIPRPCVFPIWHYKSTSNIVTLTLTSLPPPKSVADSITNESGSDKATCSYTDQTRVFSVPRLNNNETYQWSIPAGWIAYTDLQGPYANSITISTNSGGANFAKGGNVCLIIKQPGKINSMCRYIQGSEPFSVNLPAVLTGCEGSDVIVTPVVLQNNVAQPLSNYGFNWEAYQSPNTECIPQSTKYDNGCRQLKITIGNVYQNPIQPIKVTAINNHACSAMATTNLTTVPGLQMGILNSFADPKASSTSNLALNEPSDQLYFTAANGVIQRAYFDNNVNQNIWRYTELKDKNTNVPIRATGSVAFYRDATSDKVFYVNAGNIYYAETMDNGLTWTNVNNAAIVSNVSSRIKISANNIYYIDATSNQILYKSLTGTAFVLVGNAAINYSQDMFAVEEGILAYADQNNNIVAFDALTGAVLPVSIAANLKAVAYNSAISIYNKNIYYVSNAGTLRILQKSSTSTSYTAYQDVATQLAGPFTINRQTGTVYAKANDVPGKQIYYLNNQWTVTPIKNYLQGSPVQSSMVYGNGHAFYIGTNGLLSNTFYIAPCIPNVLRTSGATFAANGDAPNDPIPATPDAIDALVIYPNPAKDVAHVHVIVENACTIQIKIITLTGVNEIAFNSSMKQGSHDIELPISTYAAGAYIVQLYIDGALSATSKLIKY